MMFGTRSADCFAECLSKTKDALRGRRQPAMQAVPPCAHRVHVREASARGERGHRAGPGVSFISCVGRSRLTPNSRRIRSLETQVSSIQHTLSELVSTLRSQQSQQVQPPALSHSAPSPSSATTASTQTPQIHPSPSPFSPSLNAATGYPAFHPPMALPPQMQQHHHTQHHHSHSHHETNDRDMAAATTLAMAQRGHHGQHHQSRYSYGDGTVAENGTSNGNGMSLPPFSSLNTVMPPPSGHPSRQPSQGDGQQGYSCKFMRGRRASKISRSGSQTPIGHHRPPSSPLNVAATRIRHPNRRPLITAVSIRTAGTSRISNISNTSTNNIPSTITSSNIINTSTSPIINSTNCNTHQMNITGMVISRTSTRRIHSLHHLNATRDITRETQSHRPTSHLQTVLMTRASFLRRVS